MKDWGEDLKLTPPKAAEFARWCKTSEGDRMPKTQTQLARNLEVHVSTLSNWKKHPRWGQLLESVTPMDVADMDDGLQDVAAKVRMQALAGDMKAADLHLKYEAAEREAAHRRELETANQFFPEDMSLSEIKKHLLSLLEMVEQLQATEKEQEHEPSPTGT